MSRGPGVWGDKGKWVVHGQLCRLFYRAWHSRSPLQNLVCRGRMDRDQPV